MKNLTKKYDYIVVGAGSAGSALATRLSDDPNISVLLLEAGGKDNNIWVHIPLGIGKLWTNPKVVWPNRTEPEEHLSGQSIYLPTGKLLGGSSSINGMLYVRGAKEEYDRWRDADCPGWGYDDLLPLLKRIEDRPGGDPKYRGRGGPIKVSDVGYKDNLSEAFYAGCTETGIEATKDYNAEKYEGVAYLQMSTKNGRRASTAQGYLRPARRRKNLEVKTNSRVLRLLISGNRAEGVIIADETGKEISIESESEVILCGGALNSPKLLELSGIGRADILNKAGISVIKELTGVGENLQDHFQVRTTYECSEKITMNDVLYSKWRSLVSGIKFLFFRKGYMSTSVVTVHAITPSGLEGTRPDLKLQVAHISGSDRYSLSKELSVDNFPGFTLGVFGLHPRSRGTVHIKSSDPQEQPALKINYYADEHDKKVTMAGLKKLREIAAQPSMKKMIVREVRPGSEVISEEDLTQYIKDSGQTCWHPIGTCKMGSDSGSVVDTELRVHGMAGLRVADASVFPHMISSNTNAPSILVGERCAELLLKARDRSSNSNSL